MKSYFAYVRVSTARQGEHGTSPEEQRAAIAAYAQHADLNIIEWFNETKSAAKQGRSVFNRMLAGLERKRAAGVVIHKIDRSARNLKDWARLGELMDRGAEVHFVRDNLDLSTRGGRLSADIQAVVAADFIRNLREETLKGRYGRLKQGFYPFPAPRGYLDRGKARSKEIDPQSGPLVRKAFELYATGNYSLGGLATEMQSRGLGRSAGSPLTVDALSALLRNPFYIGLMRIKATGETFEGNHKPLVSKALFDRVQAILSGRCFPRTQIHRFRFRRLIRCACCGRSLTGERQKGHVYYRCHDRSCRGVSFSETRVDRLIRENLACLQVDDGDVRDFRDLLTEHIAEEESGRATKASDIQRDLGLVAQRLARLTDAFLDGTIDKAAYEERKAMLLAQRTALNERLAGGDSTFWQSIAERFELGLTALQGYQIGNDDEKREIIKSVSSNLIAQGKEPVLPMFSPFAELREWSISAYGLAHQGAVRTPIRDKRRMMIRRLLRTLAKNGIGTQTVPNDSRIQPTGRRPDPRPLLSQLNACGAGKSSRTAQGLSPSPHQDCQDIG